ncbi:binding [Zea mays]|jgi:hypothetical protein|uniref:Binding n=1 Tax=Zea mays TaxID=4577 RepID=A0A1D6LVL2_MAIZE|nr:binding [Zea mays]
MKPLHGHLTVLPRARSFISPAKTTANLERCDNRIDVAQQSLYIPLYFASLLLSPIISKLWLQKAFGKVTIQIDRVVMLGSVAGEYTLLPESKSGPNRNLEIEFQWSNK